MRSGGKGSPPHPVRTQQEAAVSLGKSTLALTRSRIPDTLLSDFQPRTVRGGLVAATQLWCSGTVARAALGTICGES